MCIMKRLPKTFFIVIMDQIKILYVLYVPVVVSDQIHSSTSTRTYYHVLQRAPTTCTIFQTCLITCLALKLKKYYYLRWIDIFSYEDSSIYCSSADRFLKRKREHFRREGHGAATVYNTKTLLHTLSKKMVFRYDEISNCFHTYSF